MKSKIFFFFLLLFAAVIQAQDCATGNEAYSAFNQKFEDEILRLTNVERKKRGLKPVVWDRQLAYAARYHAKEMSEENYFDHDSYLRNKRGELVLTCKFNKRIRKFADYFYVSENITAGEDNPEEAIEAWMQSPRHRKNMLDGELKKLGVGYYYNENSRYKYYWVQDFGVDVDFTPK